MHGMARSGRPKNSGSGKNSGQSRPERVRPTKELLDRRTDQLADVIRLHPHGFARPLADHPDAEWYIGRLCLVGAITPAQRDAAAAWKRAADRYARQLLPPKSPQALDLNRREPSLPPPEPDADDAEERDRQRKRFLRIRATYERYWDAVAAEGHDVLRATTDALRDVEAPLDLLSRGLTALVKA